MEFLLRKQGGATDTPLKWYFTWKEEVGNDQITKRMHARIENKITEQIMSFN